MEWSIYRSCLVFFLTEEDTFGILKMHILRIDITAIIKQKIYRYKKHIP